MLGSFRHPLAIVAGALAEGLPVHEALALVLSLLVTPVLYAVLSRSEVRGSPQGH